MIGRTFTLLSALACLALGQTFITSLPPQELQSLKARQGERIARATQLLNAERTKLQVNNLTAFEQRSAVLDRTGNLHVRYRQRHDGLRVTGAEAIVHLNRGDQLQRIDSAATVRDFPVSTKPAVTEKSALDIVRQDYMRTAGEMTSRAELVIYVQREAGIRGESTVRSTHLAWLLRVESAGQTPTFYYVDAHSGKILRTASAEISSGYLPATGSGRSGRYPNPTPFAIGLAQQPPDASKPYRLFDPTRGNNRVLNMEMKQAGNGWYGNAYWSASTNWGAPAHFDYTTMSTYSPEGIGSGFEAAFGLQRTWDLLDKVFQFTGFDGAGHGLTGRVHFRKKTDEAYGDANWDGSYLNFGDRSDGSRTHIVTVAHEAGHAMFQFALGEEDFDDEARGLNEGHGDILGSLANIFHQLGGSVTSLPAEVPREWFRNRIVNPSSYTAGGQTGLSYYVEYMGQREEHTVGCAYGHAFVMLALGATSAPGDSMYSKFLPGGMVGIGVQKAADIWHHALHNYMTSTATFASTREAYIDAASDLYGANSIEVKAVRNAFFGIGVGGGAQDTANPNISLAAPVVYENEQSAQVNMQASDDVGVISLELRLNGVLVKKVIGPGPKSWNGFISVEGLPLGTHSLRATAKDAQGKTAEVVREFTLTGRNRLIRNGAFEGGWDFWSKSGASLCSEQAAFLGGACAQFSAAGQYMYQTVTIPASASTATLNYRLRAEAFPSVLGSENLRVDVLNSSGTVLQVLANHSHLTGLGDAAAKGYKAYNHALGAYKGQTVRIRFVATAAMVERFKIDNVSLVYSAPIQADLAVNADPTEGLVSFYVSDIANLAPNQIKSVTLVINDQEVAQPMQNAPYLMVLPTSMFVPNNNYRVKARIRNLANAVVATTEEQQFMIRPVTNLLTGPGFENSYWTYGNGAYIGQNNPEAMIYNSFTGNRYAVLGGMSGVQTFVQNVQLPADADVITLGFRVRVNRALPVPDINDNLYVFILDLNNNVLDAAAVVNGSINTLQPANYRGYMGVKANISQFRGQTVRVQFRSISTAPNLTTFYVDETSIVARKLGMSN